VKLFKEVFKWDVDINVSIPIFKISALNILFLKEMPSKLSQMNYGFFEWGKTEYF
jgi:hypothetical protein